MSAKSPVCEIPKMGSDEIRQRVAGVKWFHTIDFGQGIVSPGDDDSPGKLKRLQIPSDLSGKTFLDIGAWDGFFHSRPNDVVHPESWPSILTFGMVRFRGSPKLASWPRVKS